MIRGCSLYIKAIPISMIPVEKAPIVHLRGSLCCSLGNFRSFIGTCWVCKEEMDMISPKEHQQCFGKKEEAPLPRTKQ